MILAARLGHQPFRDWVEYELNGYPEGAPLPPYREKQPVQLMGDFMNMAWKATSVPIPAEAVPEKLRDLVLLRTFPQAVSVLEELASSPNESIKSPVPLTLAPLIRLYRDMNCVSVWEEMPRNFFRGLLDQVRNKVLAFALEIEKTNPEAGEGKPGSAPIPAETVSQIHQTTIYGAGNVAIASSDVTQQSLAIDVKAGDLDSLISFLRGVGVEDPDIDELRQALDQDGPTEGRKELGEKTQSWLGKMALKMGPASGSIGKGVATAVIAEALLRFLGLG